MIAIPACDTVTLQSAKVLAPPTVAECGTPAIGRISEFIDGFFGGQHEVQGSPISQSRIKVYHYCECSQLRDYLAAADAEMGYVHRIGDLSHPNFEFDVDKN